MELTGERTLAAGRDAAWAALNDIELLKLCIPGCESLVPVAEHKYEAVVQAAIGPVKARFNGTLEMTDIDAPNGYTLRFEGNGGAAGFARGQAKVDLTEAGAAPGQTLLSYRAQAQVGGKLAQVGSRLIDAAAGAMSDKFFEAFGAQIAARGSAGGAAGAAPAAAAAIGFWGLLWATLKRLFARR